MSLRPLHDRVLIKRIEEQETVKGGNHHPGHAKENHKKAKWSRSGPARRSRMAASCHGRERRRSDSVRKVFGTESPESQRRTI